MTKIFIFVLEADRNEDLEDYITEKLSCMCKCNGMGGLLKTRPSAVPICPRRIWSVSNDLRTGSEQPAKLGFAGPRQLGMERVADRLSLSQCVLLSRIWSFCIKGCVHK